MLSAGTISLVWLAILLICIVIEIATLGLTTIWFALGALVAYFAALAGANIIVQVVVFLIVSIIALVFTRPLAMKYFNRSKREKTNAEGLIGKRAKVIEQIDNDRETGRVIVNGQEWMARTEDEDIINIDEIVEILRISGVKLIVKKQTL